MSPFGKLPGFRKSAPGLERVVLRRLPRLLLLTTLLSTLPSLLARWPGLDFLVSGLRVESVDIAVVAIVILLWTLALTAAIAAFIVLVMKGPAYVADAYPLSDADLPRRRQ